MVLSPVARNDVVESANDTRSISSYTTLNDVVIVLDYFPILFTNASSQSIHLECVDLELIILRCPLTDITPSFLSSDDHSASHTKSR